jgi:hypothetical protein
LPARSEVLASPDVDHLSARVVDFAVDAYDTMFEIEGRPCAGVFMLYGADAVWKGNSPPMPDYFEDAHAREFSRTAGPQFDGSRLAEHARQMLDEKV